MKRAQLLKFGAVWMIVAIVLWAALSGHGHGHKPAPVAQVLSTGTQTTTQTQTVPAGSATTVTNTNTVVATTPGNTTSTSTGSSKLEKGPPADDQQPSMDPQDYVPSLHTGAEKDASMTAFAQLPTTIGPVQIASTNVLPDGDPVLAVACGKASHQQAVRVYQSFLARYKDPGKFYVVKYDC